MDPMLKVRDPDTFHAEVLGAGVPTVVMFWATWCPFCRKFNADFEALAASRPWRFAAVYLDDEANPLWDDYAVDVVPTLALFRAGEIVDREDGVLGYGIDTKMLSAFVGRLEPQMNAVRSRT